MPKLLLLNQSTAKEYHLKPGMNTIGRSEQYDFPIHDNGISRLHARIQVDISESIFIFEDMGSLNGSYVNQIKTRKKILSKNDKITLGSRELLFVD